MRGRRTPPSPPTTAPSGTTPRPAPATPRTEGPPRLGAAASRGELALRDFCRSPGARVRARKRRHNLGAMVDTEFLAGRRALVTGGASGIGRACAVRLAAAGAQVVVVDRDADGARAVAQQVGGTAVAVDLSDLDAIDGLDLDV